VATIHQAGLNKPAWLHRGLGFLTGLAGCMLIASVVPSHSHTESPSAFSLASFTPAGMPAMRGTQTATSSGQTPVLQTWSPMERTAVIPTSSLRNAPPAMQMSSPAYDPLGLEASEESQRAQATTAYAVPTSHINRMQPGQNIINGDSGVSGSTLGWLSILALGTAGAYMAGLSRGTATAEMLSVSQMPAGAGEAPPIGMAMQMLADAGQAPAMADGSTAIAIGGGILAILTAGIPVFFSQQRGTDVQREAC